MMSWKRPRLILKDGSSAIERSLLKSRSATLARRNDLSHSHTASAGCSQDNKNFPLTVLAVSVIKEAQRRRFPSQARKSTTGEEALRRSTNSLSSVMVWNGAKRKTVETVRTNITWPNVHLVETR